MANKPNPFGSESGAPFIDQMSEFMEDLSTIRSLAEKLAKKMGEMSEAASASGKTDA